MDNQIKEMAKDLQETHDYDGCEAWHCGGCEYEKYGKNYFCSSIKQAEKMTAKGYRKSSNVAREIFEDIKNIWEQGRGFIKYTDLVDLERIYENKYESEKDNGNDNK